MVYELISANSSDIEKLIEYKEKSIFEYAGKLPQKEVVKIKNYICEHIPNQLAFYKIIVVDNTKVGSLLVENKDDGVILDEIYIDEKYRNKGIGTNIIKQVLSKNDIVYLWVYKLNVQAISLYRKLGFLVIDETKSRFYMKYKKINNK